MLKDIKQVYRFVKTLEVGFACKINLEANPMIEWVDESRTVFLYIRFLYGSVQSTY